MSYAALGFVQFLAPTVQFLLSLFVFHEPLKPAQLACFILIWASIAVFSFDMWRKMRADRMVEALESLASTAESENVRYLLEEATLKIYLLVYGDEDMQSEAA